MSNFETVQGETKIVWMVNLNITAIKRVKGSVEIDLVEPSSIERLINDHILLSDVIFEICSAQAKELGIDNEAFGELMHGDTIDKATEAMLDALVSFTPSPRKRKAIRTVIDKTMEGVEKVMGVLEEQIQGPAIDNMIENQVRQAGVLFTKSLESAE